MTNTPEWVVSTFAAIRLGAPVVPVNTFLRPTEISYILPQSGARHLLTLDEFRALRMPEMLTEICPDFTEDATPGYLFSESLPDLRNVVVYNRNGRLARRGVRFQLSGGGRP